MNEPENDSGPIVWALIIAVTCLLLLAFQKILFLVVPFLLALILYYILYPAVQRLVLAGMGRAAAASLVTLAILLLAVVCGSWTGATSREGRIGRRDRRADVTAPTRWLDTVQRE